MTGRDEDRKPGETGWNIFREDPVQPGAAGPSDEPAEPDPVVLDKRFRAADEASPPSAEARVGRDVDGSPLVLPPDGPEGDPAGNAEGEAEEPRREGWRARRARLKREKRERLEAEKRRKREAREAAKREKRGAGARGKARAETPSDETAAEPETADAASDDPTGSGASSEAAMEAETRRESRRERRERLKRERREAHEAAQRAKLEAKEAAKRGAAAAAEAKKAAKLKRRSGSVGFPPLQVLFGWIGEASKRDVLEHARGYASDQIGGDENAYFAAAEFRGGWLFEIHEGGSGRGYLPDVIEQLTRDPEQIVWLPAGSKNDRVVTVGISEGKPYATILSEEDSERIRESGQEPMTRSGRMRPMVRKGHGVLFTGAAMALVGAVVLAGSFVFSWSVADKPIAIQSFDPELLPHSQIVRLSESIRPDRFVTRIVFEGGGWRADFQTIPGLGLPDDDESAAKLIDQLISEEIERRSGGKATGEEATR